MTLQDLVALGTFILLTRDPTVAPERDRVAAERRALRRVRRVVARVHGMRVADVPGGRPSRGVVDGDGA